MQLQLTTFAAVLALSGAAVGQLCNNQFSRHCVSLWPKSGTGGQLVTSFVPNCDGQCHNARFESLIASGEPIALGPAYWTTRCHVWADQNCGGRKILDTGNLKSYTNFNAPGAQSIKCYYKC